MTTLWFEQQPLSQLFKKSIYMGGGRHALTKINLCSKVTVIWDLSKMILRWHYCLIFLVLLTKMSSFSSYFPLNEELTIVWKQWEVCVEWQDRCSLHKRAVGGPSIKHTSSWAQDTVDFAFSLFVGLRGNIMESSSELVLVLFICLVIETTAPHTIPADSIWSGKTRDRLRLSE